MLAYVFWHWPRPEEAPEYEGRLARFQEALRDDPSPGFRRSAVFAPDALPWLPAGARVYEEWYLLDGSAALDPLNEAAVAEGCRAAHDEAARRAAGGTAGLYRLRLGDPAGAPRFATWFGKPPGMTYEALHGLLRPLATRGTALWGRQMVLGPTPEFCLRSEREVGLPAGIPAIRCALRRVWP